MAISQIDPITALIVIDLQKGIAAIPMAHDFSQVLAQAVALIDAFRRKGLPVVLVNVDGAPPGRTAQPRFRAGFPDGWTELLPELNRQPTDILVTKQASGAFAGTGLEQRLRQLGVTEVVIVGVATSAGVESTARQAYEAGFNVALALDAMSDRSDEAHGHSIAKVFPRIAEIGSSAEILALLAGTA